MSSTMSQILIETILKKALREMNDSPERSIRNLVDLALIFSNGRFQRIFFEVAQTTLQNENSPYYDLIRDAVSHIDSQKLLTLGMNIGYNSCTKGAKIIRNLEDTCAFNIPWCISLQIASPIFHNQANTYRRIIEQGTELGIYTWHLFPTEVTCELLNLLRQYPDCAFILFCDSKDISQPLISALCDLNNVLPLISRNESTPQACGLLRQHKLPYGIYYSYSEHNAESFIDGSLFSRDKALHAVFSLLYASPDCPDVIRQTVYDFILNVRKEQKFHTIPWEFLYDTCFVDSIISEDSCFAAFTPSGQLSTPFRKNPLPDCSIFTHDLREILQLAFPKNIQKENI